MEVGKKHEEFSEAFGGKIIYYSNSALFKQKFKLKDKTKPADVVAEITYQTCNDKVCLAPNTLEFSHKIEGKTSPEEVKKEEPQKDTVASERVENTAEKSLPSTEKTILNPTQWRKLLDIFVFRIYWRVYSSAYPLCISNDSTDDFFLYEGTKR